MKKIIFIFLLFFIIVYLTINPKTTKLYVNNKLYNDKPIIETDIIGHIKINNTDIDNNIVKTNNNEFYLNHDEEKKPNKVGSIFVDYRNNLDDNKLIIYGHNSQNIKAPFHDLEKYKEKSFKEDIHLLINNENFIYKVFSIIISPKDNYKHTIIKFNSNYLGHLLYLKENSIYETNVNVDENDKIILLQTCNYEPLNTYLLICAKRS